MTVPGTAAAVRGSQKLLANLGKHTDVPNVEAIKKALQLPEAAKIPSWQTKGTPQDFVQLNATIEVPISHLNDVVKSFVGLNDSSINLNILINGIPIPDVAQVVVRNTPPGEL